MVIVTFNQDLQIEKILSEIENTKRWATKGKIFNFPYCYNIKIDKAKITSPTRGAAPLFSLGNNDAECLMILKLHGSLNWYSIHNSPTPSTKAMFKTNRRLSITRLQKIDPEMKLSGKHRQSSTLRVIVPPVTHKSGILHEKMGNLWSNAEDILKEAEELVIFGYSCPAQDFESSNLIRRSLIANRNYKLLSIIDIDAKVITRYADLIRPKGLAYYSSADAFLSSRWQN
ncbi:MAG: hypothetical protein JSU85_04230 [Candidatus Zixiibacteriota bacterium]|nr:MAG: hypothetical protein JSU85_04230 [candidate division Zixibacteria bacterium]